VREAAAPVLEAVGRLGALTAELHGALASVSDDPAFAPEPITAADATRWAGRIAEDLARTTALVRARRATLPPAVAPRAEALLECEETLTARLDDLGLLVGAGCVKIRVHGDYHLGQVLVVDDGFVILDFEGEPGRPLAERRAKRCAAVDVAGMLRSFEYAGSAARASAPAAPDHWTRWWVDIATRAFLDAYDGVASRLACRLLPASRADAARVRSVLELDKALYEVRYEIDRRPAWVGVALDGVARALGWPADV
jgi:maltose alpha-D-glucosyltransferase/alpha-amylase